ncbi:hypothetical protein ACFLVI_01445 [Chloroflexota bacterium]
MKRANTGSRGGSERAPDYTNSALVDQLCDAVIAKLAERLDSPLTFNQGVVGSNPTRLTKAR